MAGRFLDLLGTVFDKFQIGIGSTKVALKSVSNGLVIRNAADSTDANITAAKLLASGDDIDLNSDAASSSADWKMTLRRPSAGMSEARVFVLPAGNPSTGQVPYVSGYSGGVVTYDWLTVAAGTDKDVTDTTSVAFGSSSPITMFGKANAAVVKTIAIVIDTPFDGTPSLSIGITGTTSKYFAATQVDLTAPAGTVFEINPGLPAASGETLIGTYSAGGASVGAARILTTTVEPS